MQAVTQAAARWGAVVMAAVDLGARLCWRRQQCVVAMQWIVQWRKRARREIVRMVIVVVMIVVMVVVVVMIVVVVALVPSHRQH